MFHFLSVEGEAPLMLPDSVQKANLSATVEKLVNLDVNEVAQSLLQEAVWVLVKVVIALVIYYIGRWVLRRLVRIIDFALERKKVDESLRAFTRSTVGAVFMLMLVLIVVSTLGVNVTSLIAVASAATLAIGMALSGTAQNFAGGVMILLMKPYRVGDFISAQGQSGTVCEIKLFSTVITTADNQTIYIPNNSIATAIIDNYSMADTRRVDWNFSIAYGNDIDKVRATVTAMLKEDARVLAEPEPCVWITSLEPASVSVSARAWCKNADYWDLYFKYNDRFYKELPEAGVVLPTPAMNIQLKKEN